MEGQEPIESAKDLKKPKTVVRAGPWREEHEQELRDLYDRYRHSDDTVGEIISHMSIKRGRAAVMGKIVSLGLVDDRKQLYKKRGGKASRTSGQGHDSGDKAGRAKAIKTTACINESQTEKLIRELREENKKMMERLKKVGLAGSLGAAAEEGGEKEGVEGGSTEEGSSGGDSGDAEGGKAEGSSTEEGGGGGDGGGGGAEGSSAEGGGAEEGCGGGGGVSNEGPSQHRSPGVPAGGSPYSMQPLTPSEVEGRWSKYSSDNKKGGWQRLWPESATQVMKAWLFRNTMNPYPPDDVKQEMMRQTNLSLVQINNWFTNARRRIIQPMLEANNTKEAIEKLARYTSHHRTWSLHTDPDAANDQKPTNIQPGKLPVSQPQPAPASNLACTNSIPIGAVQELPKSIPIGSAQELPKSIPIGSAQELPKSIPIGSAQELPKSIPIGSAQELPKSIPIGSAQELPKSIPIGSAQELPKSIPIGSAQELPKSIPIGSAQELPKSIPIGSAQELPKSIPIGAAQELPKSIPIGSAQELPKSIPIGSAQELPKSIPIGSAQELPKSIPIGSAQELPKSIPIGSAQELPKSIPIGSAQELPKSIPIGSAQELPKSIPIGSAQELPKSIPIGSAQELPKSIPIGSAQELPKSIPIGAAQELPKSIPIGSAQELPKSIPIGSAQELPKSIPIGAVQELPKSIPIGSAQELPKSIPIGAAQELPKSIPIGSAQELPKSIPIGSAQELPKSIPIGSSQELPKSIPIGSAQELPKSIPIGAAKELPKSIPIGAAKELPKSIPIGAVQELPKSIPIGAVQELPKSIPIGSAQELPKSIPIGAAQELPKSIPIGAAQELPKSIPIGSAQELPKSSKGTETTSQTYGLGLGQWEAHTRGIGSRLMMKMGYEPGKGLGKNRAGRVEPVPIQLLPKGKSLDKIMRLKEIAGEPDLFDVLKNQEKKRKKDKEKKRKKDKEKCTIDYIQNEPRMLPRVGVMCLGALAGALAGFRGQQFGHQSFPNQQQYSGQFFAPGGQGQGNYPQGQGYNQNMGQQQYGQFQGQGQRFPNYSRPQGMPDEECKLCQVVYGTPKQKQQHLEGRKHKRKMMLVAGGDLTEKSSIDKTNTTSQDEECKLCQVVYGTPKQREQHLKGKKHIQKMKLVAGGDLTEKSSIDKTNTTSKGSKSKSTGMAPVSTEKKLRGRANYLDKKIINCKLCRRILTDRSVEGHTESKEHKKNIIKHQQQTNRKNKKISGEDQKCELCGTMFPKAKEKKQHLQGVKHKQMEEWLAEGRLVDIAEFDLPAKTRQAPVGENKTSKAASASIPQCLTDLQISNRKETPIVNGKAGLQTNTRNITPILNDGTGITVGKRKIEDVTNSGTNMKKLCIVSPIKHSVPTKEENSLSVSPIKHSVTTKEENSLSVSPMKHGVPIKEENSLSVSPMKHSVSTKEENSLNVSPMKHIVSTKEENNLSPQDKCEVSKEQSEQKQKAKEFIQAQMALPPGAVHQALSQGQGQQRSSQSQCQQMSCPSQGHQMSVAGQGQQMSGPGQGQQRPGSSQGQQRPDSGQGQRRPGSGQGQRRVDVQGQKFTDQCQQRSMSGQGMNLHALYTATHKTKKEGEKIEDS